MELDPLFGFLPSICRDLILEGWLGAKYELPLAHIGLSFFLGIAYFLLWVFFEDPPKRGLPSKD